MLISIHLGANPSNGGRPARDASIIMIDQKLRGVI